MQFADQANGFAWRDAVPTHVVVSTTQRIQQFNIELDMSLNFLSSNGGWMLLVQHLCILTSNAQRIHFVLYREWFIRDYHVFNLVNLRIILSLAKTCGGSMPILNLMNPIYFWVDLTAHGKVSILLDNIREFTAMAGYILKPELSQALSNGLMVGLVVTNTPVLSSIPGSDEGSPTHPQARTQTRVRSAYGCTFQPSVLVSRVQADFCPALRGYIQTSFSFCLCFHFMVSARLASLGWFSVRSFCSKKDRKLPLKLPWSN